MPPALAWPLWFVVAYLAGAVAFGLLLGWVRGVDIRRHGSGNVGATNCGRVLGRRWGVVCFFLDVAKGLLPVLLFGLWEAPRAEAALGPTAATVQWLGVAAAAVLGHVFPVWLRFRGGKGVATGLGVLLGFWPVLTLPALAAGAVWLAVVMTSGYVSLASVAAAAALPLLVACSAAWLGRGVGESLLFVAVTALLAALVVLRHRGNLANLRAGVEPRAAWTRRG